MAISVATQKYFEGISKKSQDYYDAFMIGKKYVLENEITIMRNATNCVLMSILWCADKLGDELTEQDVCLYLNISELDVKEGDVAIKLMPEMKEWTLEEILSFMKEA